MQEPNKGLLHGGGVFSHHLATDQDLPTLPYFHHPQPYMHLNAQRLFLNPPIAVNTVTNQFWATNEFSSPSETSSLTLNSPHGLATFTGIDEGKEGVEETEEELQMSLDQRKVRRLISNRESARRSRMRKRKQLEELQGQVFQLLAAKHQLTEKLNYVLEHNYSVLQENTQLKEEISSLRMDFAHLTNPKHDHDDHLEP